MICETKISSLIQGTDTSAMQDRRLQRSGGSQRATGTEPQDSNGEISCKMLIDFYVYHFWPNFDVGLPDS